MNNSRNWYISEFPESLYPCNPQYRKSYTDAVIRGHSIAEDSSVLICGVARNVSQVLPYTIARINKLVSYFSYYTVYIYENDSEDTTLSTLREWEKLDKNVHLESEILGFDKNVSEVGHERTVRMAYCRNQYLAFARKRLEDYDYVIVLDTDLKGGWSYHGILNSIGHDLDIVGSNGLFYRKVDKDKDDRCRLFYDSWAFRHLGHNKPHILEEINLLTYNRGESPIQVGSCFGGLAVYKWNVLNNDCVYKSGDCDHPTLHKQLVERGYEVYLNPSQITLYNWV